MKKIKYNIIVPALVGLLLVASCTKESADTGAAGSVIGKDPISVPISYSSASLTAIGSEASGIGTRTVPTTGLTNVIKNMWVIQFDGTLSTSNVVGVPRFIDHAVIDDLAKTGVVSLLPTVEAYQVWIANMPQGASYDWGLSASSTFADVATKILTGETESPSWATIDGSNTLIMNSITKSVVNSSTTLEPKFMHTAAKVSLKIENLAAGLTITSARLCNIPTKIYVADQALSELSLVNGTSIIWPFDSPFLDYLSSESHTVTATADINSAKSGTYTWLMPRNNQGINPLSTSAQSKTYYAPKNATYFEIKVTDGTKSGVFKIYPGENQTNDYNLTPNSEYTSTIDINGVGDPETTDSRVTQTYEDLDFRGTQSNCYILNPNPGAVRTFKVPVTQVNRYWSAAAEGYGTAANAIGETDAWTVAVIWSDIDGNAASYISKATGTGPNDYFEIALPAESSLPAGRKMGNFTVKISKNSAPAATLWSWHFWVTDYNPDGFSNSAINNTKVNGGGVPNGIFTYAVSGGQVERYTGGLWAAGGVYEKKVMMDRAIGAVENYFTTKLDNSSRGLLTYQYGRKDPFPVATGSTNFYGTALAFRPSPVDDQVLISAGVVAPTQFYNRTISGGNWTSEADRLDYVWNDPVGSRTGSKSVYDPCPAGWRVPRTNTWDSFNNTTTLNPLRDLGWGSGRGIGTGASQIAGLRYWPGTTNASPATGRIWYPASGFRFSTSGGLSNVGSYGLYWSCSPYTAANGYILGFNSGGVNPSNSNNRAYGFPVRCVQE